MYQTDEEQEFKTEKERIAFYKDKDSRRVRYGIIAFSVGMTLLVILIHYLTKQ